MTLNGCGIQPVYFPSSSNNHKFVERDPLTSTDPIAQKYEDTFSGISFQYPQEFILATSTISQPGYGLFKRGNECLASIGYYSTPFNQDTYYEFAYLDKDIEVSKFRIINTARAIAPTVLKLQNPHNVTIGDKKWFTFSVDQSSAKEKELDSECQETKIREVFILPQKDSYFKFTFYGINQKTIEKMLATVKISKSSLEK
jgi:hypothetical protein